MESNSNMTPNELLFTKADGTHDHFYEVLWDELDSPESYANRVPFLIDLMYHGQPYHRLLACIMLTSWGYLEGFQILIEWANHLDTVPWNKEPIMDDRITSADSAFEKLAEAIGTSYSDSKSKEISTLRKTTVKTLLKIFPVTFFDNTLAFTIYRGKDELLPDVFKDICTAIDHSLEILNYNEKPDFNLQMQVASLIGTLDEFDELTVIKYTETLIEKFPDDRRMLFELVSILGGCKLPEALKILESLYQSDTDLKEHISQAMKRFKELQVA